MEIRLYPALFVRFSALCSLPDFDFKHRSYNSRINPLILPQFFFFSLVFCQYLSPLALSSPVAIALATMFL